MDKLERRLWEAKGIFGIRILEEVVQVVGYDLGVDATRRIIEQDLTKTHMKCFEYLFDLD